jgi:hypothetical protein
MTLLLNHPLCLYLNTRGFGHKPGLAFLPVFIVARPKFLAENGLHADTKLL